MMNERIPQQENMPQRVILRSGIDFIDNHEVHDRLINELIRRDIRLDSVILCGYEETDQDSGSSRTELFAMTMEGTGDYLEYGSTSIRTPYEYAEDAIGGNGKSVVAVYNAGCFKSGREPDHYVLNSGLTIEDASVLLVELSYDESA